MKQNNLSLNEIGDKTVFKVPENYFINFEAELEKRLDNVKADKLQVDKNIQTESGSKRFFLSMETVKPILYMAAMFVLVLFSISLVLNFKSNNTSSSSLGLSVESSSQSASSIPTAEDYLINSVGTYGITEYYLDSENAE